LQLLNFSLNAQDQYLKHYSIESGLPSSTVYSCFQDGKGFIWFTTDIGVCRFDGRNFELFTTSEGLPGNEVFSIYEDSNNRLWFQTLNGHIGYYLEGKFHNIQEAFDASGVTYSGYISAITEDEKGNIILSTSTGYILQIDLNLQLNSSKPFSHVVGINYDKKNQLLFIICSDGIYTYDSKLNNYSQHYVFDLKYHKRSYFDSDAIFVSNGKVLEKYYLNRDSVAIIRSFEDEIISFEKTTEGVIYLGTRSGMYANKKHSKNQFVKVNKQYLHNKEISSILHDEEGNSWISTLHHGVYMSPSINTYQITGINTPVFTLFNLKDSLLLAGGTKGAYIEIDKSDNISSKLFETFHGKNKIIDFKYIGNDLWIIGKNVFIKNSANNKKSYFVFGGNDITEDRNGNYIWSSHKAIRIVPKEILESYFVNESQIRDAELGHQLSVKWMENECTTQITEKEITALLSMIKEIYGLELRKVYLFTTLINKNLILLVFRMTKWEQLKTWFT
jgi:ligand-binding sensor domain-containing protein